MTLHRNARTCPASRRLMARRVLEEGWTLTEAAEAAGVSVQRAGVLTVRRTLSGGEVVDLGKTERSRRQVPLSRRALDALDAIPARMDTPLIFPGERGGVLNLDNFRRRM